MSRKEQVPKSLRKQVRRQYAQQLRERKRIRRLRGEIHGAMKEALRMKRSKKKGTADLDANMERLGWRFVKAEIGMPVEQRFERIS